MTLADKGLSCRECAVDFVAQRVGRILYEIEGVDEKTARDAMRLAAQKLPIKTKFVTRADQEGGAI